MNSGLNFDENVVESYLFFSERITEKALDILEFD